MRDPRMLDHTVYSLGIVYVKRKKISLDFSISWEPSVQLRNF